jgi:XTP/dITP diphosphohydrolase
MELLFATTNKGKISEISEIIKLKGYTNIAIAGIENSIAEPEENGTTYKENAEIKFLYYQNHIKTNGKILFSEDSGLEIPALEHGIVGVNSAPFMKKFQTKMECFLKIKEMLEQKHSTAEELPAYFFCNICTQLDGKILHFEGKIEGFLTFENITDDGFGYDPIFIPQNSKKTFAKMKSTYKNEISHRATAFDKFMKYTQNV